MCDFQPFQAIPNQFQSQKQVSFLNPIALMFCGWIVCFFLLNFDYIGFIDFMILWYVRFMFWRFVVELLGLSFMILG